MKSLIRILAILGLLSLAPATFALVYEFDLTLTGQAEIGPDGSPGAGDLDGSGSALLVVNPHTQTISWNFWVQDISLPLTGAHIHIGPAGANGPVVVNFNSALEGMNLFDPNLSAILSNPAGYYLNLHNADFPAGALRGQLGEPRQVPDTLGAAWAALAIGIALAAGRRYRRGQMN